MLENQIAERYAKSWLALAQEQKAMDKVLKDIYLLDQYLKQNKDFNMLMHSPVISLHTKDTIWKKISTDMHPITQRFVSLLIRKTREIYLKQIIQAFIAQDKQINGVVDAVIYSPIPLTPSILKTIQQIVKKETNANSVQIENRLNETLIGGFVLQIKDIVIDLSIAKKLKDIERQILA